MHHGAALTRESGDPALQEAVASGDFRRLNVRMRTLCAYAVKLTLYPHRLSPEDIDVLRSADLDDRTIVDANQVVSYFNYVNRIADGLGVELEREWPEEVRAQRRYPIRGSSGSSEHTS